MDDEDHRSPIIAQFPTLYRGRLLELIDRRLSASIDTTTSIAGSLKSSGSYCYETPLLCVCASSPMAMAVEEISTLLLEDTCMTVGKWRWLLVHLTICRVSRQAALVAYELHKLAKLSEVGRSSSLAFLGVHKEREGHATPLPSSQS